MLAKRLPSFLLLFLFAGLAWAQPYQSTLGSQFTAWNIVLVIPDITFTDSLTASRDTTFGSHDYKIVEKDGTDVAYYREDSIAGKAWYYDLYSAFEYLVMDLELAVGDTFWVDPNGLLRPAVVDSVYWHNGRKHVRTDFRLFPANAADWLTFIEGVGPNAGVFFQSTNGFWGSDVQSRYLLCASQDTVQTYSNTLFWGICNITVIGLPSPSDAPWCISPNPVQAGALIHCKAAQPARYHASITDLSGRTVKEFASPVQSAFEIETARLAPGIYLLGLRQGGVWLGSKKVLIE